MTINHYISQYPAFKQFVHYLLIPRHQARPRHWVSWFVNPLVHHKHSKSLVRRTVRLDVLPFKKFALGAHSTIEDFSVINNGVGDVSIGDNCRVGIGCVVIGPVKIGSNVILAQHVVVSGLNHGYENVQLPIRCQPVTTKKIVIEDDCWIGANVVITAGVTIGKHSVVAGGSVVVKDVPPFSVVGGNPARLLKQYDPVLDEWVKPVYIASQAAQAVGS